MVDTIFFDVDGTLYDESYPKVMADLAAMRLLSGRCGLPVSQLLDAWSAAKRDIFARWSGDPGENDRVLWFRQLLHNLKLPGDPGELTACYWQAALDEVRPYGDLVAALPALAERYRLHLLTDELPEIQEQKLARLGLRHWFGQLFCAQQAGALKPAPQLFLLALRETGTAPGQALMVGDSPYKDIRGAAAVGMHTAWLRRGMYHQYPCEAQDRAEIVLSNFVQLPERLRALSEVIYI